MIGNTCIFLKTTMGVTTVCACIVVKDDQILQCASHDITNEI